MTVIKVCGIKTLDNALMVAEAGADIIGLNFYQPSPRSVTPTMAARIVAGVRAELGDESPLFAGVFVNATAGDLTACMQEVGFDFYQLSGDESVELLRELGDSAYKAVRPPTIPAARDDIDYFSACFSENEHCPSLLVDAFHPSLYGGTGEAARIDVARYVKQHIPRLMLAGGLNPDNVADRVSAVQPWGVDVASGVENGTPGVKSAQKVRDFVQAVRSAS